MSLGIGKHSPTKQLIVILNEATGVSYLKCLPVWQLFVDWFWWTVLHIKKPITIITFVGGLGRSQELNGHLCSL